MKNFAAWWKPVPFEHPDPGAVRARNVVLRLAPLGTTVHAAWTPIFALLGAWPLVWFNLAVSVPLWLAAVVAVRRGLLWLSILLFQSEIILHALVATRVIGWESGFHIYAITVIATASFGGALYRPLSLGLALAAAAAWVFEFVAWRHTAPLAPLGPTAEAIIGFVSFASAFFLVAGTVAENTLAADAAERALKVEHERSERLLRNILPDEIAARLKDSDQVIADGIDEASVLFADVVGFTRLSAAVTPQQLVAMLNDVFTRIDGLAHEYGLEKIKTIGDAYMVAAGVPRPRPDHASALAGFALELVGVLDALEGRDGVRLQMRIGMHSGPLVAGVIGKSKFAYDLWGDTVNTAARMESHGVPGRIQITEAVRQRLGPTFALEERGVIDVKGKGEMRTWFLTGRGAA
jgi:adenylate cyclase